MCSYILSSDVQNHTPVHSARQKGLPELLFTKQNPLSLQNMLLFRTLSARRDGGSMHSSDPLNSALLHDKQTLQITPGLVNTHLGFAFPRVSFETAQFLWAPFNHTCTRTQQHTTLCLNTKNQAWRLYLMFNKPLVWLGNQ